jgi:hypothetical protein
VADEVWKTALRSGCTQETRLPDGADPGALWQALHLLLLRLPAERATDLRQRAAEAVGAAPDQRDDLLVPAWPDQCAAVDLGEPDPPVGSPVDDARRRVRENATGEVWTRDAPLLDALRTALVLVALAPAELRLPYRPFRGGTRSTAGEVGPRFLEEVDRKLRQRSQENRPDDAGPYVAVLELVLAVVTVPAPHPQSRWAANAEAAIDHVERSLAGGDARIVRPPTGRADLAYVEKPDDLLKLNKPPWAASGQLLWTLKPRLDVDGRTVLGAGIYAR